MAGARSYQSEASRQLEMELDALRQKVQEFKQQEAVRAEIRQTQALRVLEIESEALKAMRSIRLAYAQVEIVTNLCGLILEKEFESFRREPEEPAQPQAVENTQAVATKPDPAEQAI